MIPRAEADEKYLEQLIARTGELMEEKGRESESEREIDEALQSNQYTCVQHTQDSGSLSRRLQTTAFARYCYFIKQLRNLIQFSRLLTQSIQRCVYVCFFFKLSYRVV